MRRKERAVTDEAEIISIIDQCKVCRIAMQADDGYPYLVPVNFGYEYRSGRLTLYAHSAKEGRKIDLLTSNPRVCVEMDCNHELVEGEIACKYGFLYSSLIGQGTVELLTSDEDKLRALHLLMKHQTGREDFDIPVPHLAAVAVLKITLHRFSAKARMA